MPHKPDSTRCALIRSDDAPGNGLWMLQGYALSDFPSFHPLTIEKAMNLLKHPSCPILWIPAGALSNVSLPGRIDKSMLAKLPPHPMAGDTQYTSDPSAYGAQKESLCVDQHFSAPRSEKRCRWQSISSWVLVVLSISFGTPIDGRSKLAVGEGTSHSIVSCCGYAAWRSPRKTYFERNHTGMIRFFSTL